MPDLFTPYTLKGVTLRNRIAMSPMTMYRSEPDGKMNDFHLMLMGSRAAGGFGLVFPEQIAITPDGCTSTACAGLWAVAQLKGHGLDLADLSIGLNTDNMRAKEPAGFRKFARLATASERWLRARAQSVMAMQYFQKDIGSIGRRVPRLSYTGVSKPFSGDFSYVL